MTKSLNFDETTEKNIIKDEKGESGRRRKNFIRLFRAFKLFNII